MTRGDRKKASDWFRETEFVFGEKVPFEQAFPNIERVTVEYEEQGEGVRSIFGTGNTRRGRLEHTSPHGSGIGEYIDCSNPRCYRGGFSIGRIISDMVQTGETEREFRAVCQGYEGSPQGRERYGPCINSWRGTVRIKYRPTAAPSESHETVPNDR